jgi:hypothetical protein
MVFIFLKRVTFIAVCFPAVFLLSGHEPSSLLSLLRISLCDSAPSLFQHRSTLLSPCQLLDFSDRLTSFASQSFDESSQSHGREYTLCCAYLEDAREDTMNEKSWKFTVVGCDSNDIPKYLGFFETREDAGKSQKEMETAGWHRVAVFDAAHQEQIATLQKELAAKDKQLEHWERLLKEQQGHGRGR